MLRIYRVCVEHNRPIAYLAQPTCKKTTLVLPTLLNFPQKNHPLLKATEI